MAVYLEKLVDNIYLDDDQCVGNAKNHTHFLSIQDIVKKVFEHRKQEYITIYGEEYGDYFNEKIQLERITKLESAFREGHLPSNWDSYEPAGGIKLSIDPLNIDFYVQEKFLALRKSGLILRRSEFESKYDSTQFRQPGQNQNQDLTRLWGAEYLREKLIENENYVIPRFFIIVNDDTLTIPISVIKDEKSIVVKDCDTAFAEVVVEKVDDSRANCTEGLHGWMRTIGYIDYADAGNIREKNQKFYIVDTEWKSLDGVVDLPVEKLSHLSPSIRQMRQYASERFNVLYTDEWKKTVNVKIDF